MHHLYLRAIVLDSVVFIDATLPIGMSQEDTKKHSFNILIYEYLLKNNFEKTANTFMEELGIANITLGNGASSLSTWYDAFIETAEVRSGEKFIPESLNRIEGIMFKLENDKHRYSRMRSFSTTGGSFDPGSQNASSFDKCSLHRRGIYQNGPIDCSSQGIYGSVLRSHPLPGPHPLSEIKRIDLGISAITTSCFCPLNSILIVHSSDGRIHFYNLATNEIEYGFSTRRKGMKMIKAIESGDTIYFAYSCDGYCVNVCSYAHMKKDDMCAIESETLISDLCLSKDYVYVLDGMIKMFTLSGACVRMLVCQGGTSIEWINGSLAVARTSKISEYDAFLSGEIGVIAVGTNLAFKAKGGIAFIILDGSIQAIDIKRDP